MRAVVVGIVAFQTYGPLLGVRFENAAGQIGDLKRHHRVFSDACPPLKTGLRIAI